MTNDPLDYLYTVQKEPWLKRYGKRILGGIACSAAVAIVMHLPYVWVLLLWVCHIVTVVFGKPAGAEKLERIMDKGERVVAKAQQIARDHHGGGGALRTLILPTVGQAKKAVSIAKKVHAAEQKAAHGIDAVKGTGEKIVEALAHVGDKAKGAVVGAKDSVSGMLKARSEKKQKEQREALEAHAALIGVKVDPEWTMPRLQGEVLKAELAWQARHGPNCQCPNPRCRHLMRVSLKTTENVRCVQCSLVFSARTGRRLFAENSQRTLHLPVR